MGDRGSAYEGVDSLDSFSDSAALFAYRTELLARSAQQSAFIAARLDSVPTSGFEIACGNGRLLIDLARRGTIDSGSGIDLAESRIAFADEWVAAENLHGLSFRAGDVLTAELPRGKCRLAICITGALGYFEPAGAGLGAQVVDRLASALAPGGLAVIELYPHPEYRRLLEATGGRARVWQELPASDPWRYYLSQLVLDGNVLTHRKTFIHRSEARVDEGREEQLWLYDAHSATQLLKNAGLTDIACFEGWTDRPYGGGETLVITARAA
jgi:SAM-dependent methyltransferase